jgi:hypothetical protein
MCVYILAASVFRISTGAFGAADMLSDRWRAKLDDERQESDDERELKWHRESKEFNEALFKRAQMLLGNPLYGLACVTPVLSGLAFLGRFGFAISKVYGTSTLT